MNLFSLLSTAESLEESHRCADRGGPGAVGAETRKRSLGRRLEIALHRADGGSSQLNYTRSSAEPPRPKRAVREEPTGDPNDAEPAL